MSLQYAPRELATVPYTATVATTDELPLGINMAGALTNVVGGTVSDVVTALSDSGTPVTLPDPPTVTGVVVTQIIRGSTLIVGHQYLLRVVFTANADTVLTTLTQIVVPA